MFLPDSSPEFDIFHPFYKEQLSKNLAVNILKNGQWGTYRHLLLENNGDNLLEHCYMNSVVPGDLSSLRWLEGPLSWNDKLQPGRVLVSVINNYFLFYFSPCCILGVLRLLELQRLNDCFWKNSCG